MNINVSTEQLCSREIICRTTQEQAIDLDYVLPDYEPGIFRIIRCTAHPSVISCSVNGDRLTYELSILLRIIYCSDKKKIHTIEKKLNFPKSLDLDREGTAPCARIVPCIDYINCRAASGQRVDIHGAVTISVTVSAGTSKEAVSDADGGDIILRKQEITVPSSEIRAEKRLTVSDTFDPGESKPPAADILRASASVVSADKKIISDKLAAKGELKISMLYVPPVPEENGVSVPETMQFTMPFSQIIEMDGIDETYETRIRVFVTNCEIVPVSPNSRAVECNVSLLIEACAVRYGNITAATDEFSPRCRTEHSSETIKIARRPDEIEQNVTVKGTAEHRDAAIESVYDAWCEVISCDTMRADDGSISVSGRAVCYCIAGTSGGDTVICTADTPYRADGISAASGYTPEVTADLTAEAVSCSYNLTSDNSVEIKAEIHISGDITDFERIEAITSITADEDDPSEKKDPADTTAVKLYFAEKGEDLWEVAKRCRTSPDAITSENDLDGMIMQNAGMIIIPILYS